MERRILITFTIIVLICIPIIENDVPPPELNHLDAGTSAIVTMMFILTAFLSVVLPSLWIMAGNKETVLRPAVIQEESLIPESKPQVIEFETKTKTELDKFREKEKVRNTKKVIDDKGFDVIYQN